VESERCRGDNRTFGGHPQPVTDKGSIAFPGTLQRGVTTLEHSCSRTTRQEQDSGAGQRVGPSLGGGRSSGSLAGALTVHFIAIVLTCGSHSEQRSLCVLGTHHIESLTGIDPAPQTPEHRGQEVLERGFECQDQHHTIHRNSSEKLSGCSALRSRCGRCSPSSVRRCERHDVGSDGARGALLPSVARGSSYRSVVDAGRLVLLGGGVSEGVSYSVYQEKVVEPRSATEGPQTGAQRPW
jgi:hypothetical protein